MANYPTGTHFSGPVKLGPKSMLLTTETGGAVSGKVFTADESNGQHYILDAAVGFTVTLPPPTQGWSCEFTVGATFITTAYVITAGTAATFEGCILEAGAVQDVAIMDTLTLVADKENIGDFLRFWSDGTSTFVFGNFLTAASITPGT